MIICNFTESGRSRGPYIVFSSVSVHVLLYWLLRETHHYEFVSFFLGLRLTASTWTTSRHSERDLRHSDSPPCRFLFLFPVRNLCCNSENSSFLTERLQCIVKRIWLPETLLFGFEFLFPCLFVFCLKKTEEEEDTHARIQTDRRTDRRTDGRTDRQTDRHTHTHTHC